MNEENKMKNNKKAIIVVIVMLITLALTSTIAFFTASSTKETGNIITADINDTLKFQELEKIMNPGLIPLKDEDLLSAANNGCQDKKGYNVCSAYLFSVENISDVAQEIKLSLIPTVNTFENLYYVLIDVTGIDLSNGLTTVPDTRNKLEYNNLNSIEMKNNINLNSGVTKTYALLLYIKGLEIDQTAMDADKSFGAGIRVDSITTGKYITKNFGESCWTVENGNKLTAFHGINDDGGVNESCTGYVEKDDAGLYSVNIPSNVGGNDITIIGNNLFTAGVINENGLFFNNYSKIKEITISEGIVEIEDGIYNENFDSYFGAFSFVGMNESFSPTYTITINLVNRKTSTNDGTLKKIGIGAFSLSALEAVSIPRSVERIENYAFGDSFSDISYLIFEGSTDETETGKSLLNYIGDSAFNAFEDYNNTKVTYLNIPASVTYIGRKAFSRFKNLNSITFGTENSVTQLEYLSGFDHTGLTSIIIPKSVKTIGNFAFTVNNLNSVIFEENSELTTIEDRAFSSNILNYTESNPLLLPSTITTMGEDVFRDNPNLLAIKFTGDTTNFPGSWNLIDNLVSRDKYATIITN